MIFICSRLRAAEARRKNCSNIHQRDDARRSFPSRVRDSVRIWTRDLFFSSVPGCLEFLAFKPFPRSSRRRDSRPRQGVPENTSKLFCTNRHAKGYGVDGENRGEGLGGARASGDKGVESMRERRIHEETLYTSPAFYDAPPPRDCHMLERVTPAGDRSAREPAEAKIVGCWER